MKKETDALHQIAQASEAIRRKHRMIKLGKETAERMMSEALKPVVDPLEKLVGQTAAKKQQKNEVPRRKEEEEDAYATAFGDDLPEVDELFDDIPYDAQSTRIMSTPLKVPTVKEDSPLGTKESSQKNFSLKVMTPDERLASTSVLDTSKDSELLVKTYLDRFNTPRETEMDTEFGVRNLKTGMKIGDSLVTFDQNSMTLQGVKHILTPGLIELIFKKSPNMNLITETDKKLYSEIIVNTNAHKHRYMAGGKIRATKSTKFHNIIKNLIGIPKSGESLLPQHMVAMKGAAKIDYVYWDDPNELVDRLRLLMASQTAGNTSHTNEIMSILEELREAGIIY